ncbi:hypothetical protein CI238_09614 [Colletotrichum incanum]|uniref:Uncharacterized protein n=1 Tax=Colletotrichum incanum TaxID=1573173 RepID=A0A167EAG9_COLIC|nr:hypothetical protein CI238_09614 [Colletotrichum incanum]
MLGYDTEGGRVAGIQWRLSGHGSDHHARKIWLKGPSVRDRRRNERFVVGRQQPKILLLGTRTHSNGGFDMIRSRILRLYPASFEKTGSTNDRRNTRSWVARKGHQRGEKNAGRSLVWWRASGLFGTHINKKITQKNHLGGGSLDGLDGFRTGSVLHLARLCELVH